MGNLVGPQRFDWQDQVIAMTLPSSERVCGDLVCSVIDLCIDFHFRATTGRCLGFNFILLPKTKTTVNYPHGINLSKCIKHFISVIDLTLHVFLNFDS